MKSPYWLFKAKLLPLLPFFIAEAKKIRDSKPNLPPISENLVLQGGNKWVLVFGESTAAGVGATQVDYTLAGHFKSHLGENYSILSLGKNGLQAKDAIPFFESNFHFSENTLNGITLFMGANDCFRLTSPKEFKIQLYNLILFLKNRLHPAWIYLADIPPVHLFPAFSPRLKAQLAIQRTFLQKEMKNLAQGDQSLFFEPISLDISPDFFSADEIHPSDLGYQKIAQFAIQGLRVSGLLSE